MEEEILRSDIRLIDDSVQFECRSKDRPPIVMDYYPPLGGGEGYTALEVFLASLGACVSGTILPLLRKMRKEIREYSLEVVGTRSLDHPKSLKAIVLKIRIKGSGISLGDLERVMELAESKYCPVMAMIKGNVDLRAEYRIEE